MTKTQDQGSTDRFGYEWSNYTEIIPEYELQFLKWVAPLTKEDFKDKAVLDGGCGIGRNSYWPLTYGASAVTAFDFDTRTVEVARKNLSNYPNATIEYNSLYEIPYENKFDIAFSIGVIHHLEFPRRAVKNLVRAVKPGGKVLIWVYGYESNEWIVRYINPIRLVTSKLPIWVTHLLSNLFTIPLYLYVKLIPQRHAYMKQIAKFKFWHIRSIVFDQLLPKIANYWKREEAMALFDGLSVRDVTAYQVNENSWTVIGTKV